MITQALSMLFPPSLRSLGRLRVEEDAEFDEQGQAGPVREKKYRDGIERHFAEEAE